jgi:hypothetical protein
LEKKKIFAYEDIIDDISKALLELEGEQIVKWYEAICGKKIKYLGDSIWEEV